MSDVFRFWRLLSHLPSLRACCHSLCFFLQICLLQTLAMKHLIYLQTCIAIYPSRPPFNTMFLFQTRLKWESDYPDKRKTISPDFFLFVNFVLFHIEALLSSLFSFFFSTFVNNDFEALTKDGLYKEEEKDLARLFLFVNCAISKWAISLCMSA